MIGGPLPQKFSRGCPPCGNSCGYQSLKRVFFMLHLWLHFGGALCVSELLAQSKADNEYRALLLQDVQFIDTGVRIKLRWSKMDQAGKGNVINLSFCAIEELCPVLASRCMLQ